MADPTRERNQPPLVNAPTPLPALIQRRLAGGAHFRREHFPPPAPVDRRLWVGGAVSTPRIVTLDELRRLDRRTLAVVLECAGHRRAELRPATPGLQWRCGAVAEARWTGTPLAGLLEAAGLRDNAVEVVVEGGDRGPVAGHPGSHRFARSLPLAKALDPDTIVAWAMDGRPVPVEHGGPLRLIVPGWYATDSIKWLRRIRVVSTPFDGPFQAGDYRFRRAGEAGPGDRLDVLPVHSLIAAPEPGAALAAGSVRVAGVAWSGGGEIAAVELRVDRGPWRPAELVMTTGRYGRTFWHYDWQTRPGRHTLAVRARDATGAAQPARPVWNQGGYANNAVHRIAVTVKGDRS